MLILHLACSVAALCPVTVHSPTSGDDPQPTPTNLGLAAFGGAPYSRSEGDTLAFLVSEMLHGGTDLNGDGDADDWILHAYDAVADTVWNTAEETYEFQVAENVVAFAVWEGDDLVDLNGDGDTGDFVLHVFDVDEGELYNVGLAVQYPEGPGIWFPPHMEPIQLHDDFVVVPVYEYEQGATDLNGDGDPLDWVVHVHDLRTRTTTNLALAVWEPVVYPQPHRTQVPFAGGRWIGIPVDETAQGRDENGDGDLTDDVLFVHDRETGTTTSTGLAMTVETEPHYPPSSLLTGIRPRIHENWLAFVVDERDQGGTDLNGDGDALDHVLHLFNPVTDTLTNLGALRSEYPYHPAFSGEGAGTFALGDGFVAYGLSEMSNGNVDLNGDGDADDAVFHTYEWTIGRRRNWELAVGFYPDLEILAEGGFTGFLADEASQSADMNGDDDLDDWVPHGLDVAHGSMRNSGLASRDMCIARQGGFLAAIVLEPGQGRQDLNGDDDAVDWVLHAMDLWSGEVVNAGVAMAESLTWIRPKSIFTDGHQVIFSANEADQGAVDLNGDGDAADWVAHMWNPRSGLLWNSKLAAWPEVAVGGRIFSLGVAEFGQGKTDLNGDGDSSDFVIHVVSTAGESVPGGGSGLPPTESRVEVSCTGPATLGPH
jgi:hypothetical protein